MVPTRPRSWSYQLSVTLALVILCSHKVSSQEIAPVHVYQMEELENVTDVDYQEEVDKKPKCDVLEDVVQDMMGLFSYYTVDKNKLKEMKGNVKGLNNFTFCFEMALIEAEKLELENEELVEEKKYRGGKFFGLDLEIHKSKDTSKRVLEVARPRDRWRGRGRKRPGCWVDRRWEGRTRYDNGWRRWGNDRDSGRRRWRDGDGRFGPLDYYDDCPCEDDICCDCEPDRGSDCCRDWCEFTCNDDPYLNEFCDDNWCSPMCRKFDHCCSGHCYW
jgi:hypothetical protein